MKITTIRDAALLRRFSRNDTDFPSSHCEGVQRLKQSQRSYPTGSPFLQTTEEKISGIL
jgi:hypothetical protein